MASKLARRSLEVGVFPMALALSLVIAFLLFLLSCIFCIHQYKRSNQCETLVGMVWLHKLLVSVFVVSQEDTVFP